VEKFYDRHPEQFAEPATARFRMLTLRFDRAGDDPTAATAAARATLEDVQRRLRAGEDWVPIYRELNPSDGDRDPLDGLVTLQEGDSKYAKEIADFAFLSAKGTVSDIRQLRSSFYLLYAEGATPARTIALEEAQNRVRSHLTSLKRGAAAYEVELDLLQDATVEPEAVREELRRTLRDARRKLVQEAGF
jgi:hypothetical protein